MRVIIGDTPQIFMRTADGDAYEAVLTTKSGRTATIRLLGADLAAGGQQTLEAFGRALESALEQLEP